MKLKIKPENKKYIRLVAGIILLVPGIVFMFIPFIPLGYVLIFASLFLLATYIPPLKRLLEKLRKKDKKNIVGKVEDKINKAEEYIDEKLVEEDGEENKAQETR